MINHINIRIIRLIYEENSIYLQHYTKSNKLVKLVTFLELDQLF